MKVNSNTVARDNRIVWIDIAKFFGIFAVYLGHYGENAGKSTAFVFTFHVPLFFVIAGYVETLRTEFDIKIYCKKIIKGILIPFYFFVISSIIVWAIQTDASLGEIKNMLGGGIILGAIRNHFFAGSLWFLSCLFIIKVVFMLLKRFERRYTIFIIFTFTYIFFIEILLPHFGKFWPYNIDQALYYGIYFGIGYTLFPIIVKLFMLNTTPKKVIFIISGLGAFIYASFFWEGRNLLEGLRSIPVLNLFSTIIDALIIIWCVFVLAKLCEGFRYLALMGSDTLYLCGNEWIIKAMMQALLSLIGLGSYVDLPLKAYIYTFILICLADRFLIPIEKKLLSLIKSTLDIKLL